MTAAARCRARACGSAKVPCRQETARRSEDRVREAGDDLVTTPRRVLVRDRQEPEGAENPSAQVTRKVGTRG